MLSISTTAFVSSPGHGTYMVEIIGNAAMGCKALQHAPKEKLLII
jgi:hypothetical protein